MSEFLGRVSHFSPKRLALLADELNDRVQELELAGRAPIAIVGIGCRFPGGADTPEKLWDLVRDGVDAITEVPADRWPVDDFYDPDPDRAGKMSTRWGGFIGPVDGFDPHFFGISPREAHSMDPQQRVVLEVTWRALEDAAISPQQLEGTRTGVYLGLSAGDYYHLMRSNGLEDFDAYTASGTAHSIASGRIAYVLGLRGPAVSIDTACSSSLVAIYQAVHALRRGECDLALAGGVNLVLSPDITIALSRSHMMAPDGRCKAFDARADGFVRGEGCGMLVLKRLADATAAGDRVIAVIRGAASNQDGRSNGLTAPNGPSQEAVLRDALADARVEPAQVGFVEAHGTGTSLGDPIEVQALARVVGEGRDPRDPLLVGSIKANIGHLEAAAGVAAVIKLAMVLRHGEVPGQLHLQKPNPFIPWGEIPVRAPTALTPWARPADGMRIGGVSSFGFSGTNVHLVLEEAPLAEPAESPNGRPVHLLTASARSEPALRAVAQAYRDHLAASGAVLADVAYTANAGRAHFPHRLAVVAPSAAEAVSRLDQHLRGESDAGVIEGVAGGRPPRVAFLFTGQGAQYPGMARQLYDTEPTFKATLDRCDELLRGVLPRPLLSVLYPPAGESSPIDETEYTQPALFAVEYALATLWMSWGIRPNAVLGHSVGEYVAACIAGVFSLEDGLKLIAERGRLMGTLARNGAMAAVMADETRVKAAIAPWKDDLSIGAVNGPKNTVVSGRATAVDALLGQLAAEGITSTRLNVSHAFHSALVEPILEAFAAVAATVQYRPPQIDVVSNLTGQLAGARLASASYWSEHVRATVRFGPAIQTVAAGGSDVFLEIGPQPILLGMARQCLGGDTARWLPSLRKGRGDWEQMVESLAGLYAAGAAVDWTTFDAACPRRKSVLPGYPFQRDRYWVDARPAHAGPPRTYLHPLLGWEVAHSVSSDRLFETELGTDRLPYLEDHRILGRLLLPSPVYIEMALAAAACELGAGLNQVEDLTIHQALSLEGGSPARVQFISSRPNNGSADVRISAYDAETSAWRLQATGRVTRAPSEGGPAADLGGIRARVTEPVPVADYYAWLAALGLEFGPRFRGVDQIFRCDGEVLAAMRLPSVVEPGADAYRLHPALLDSCFHVIGAALPGGGTVLKDAFLLLNIERIRVYRSLGDSAWNHVVVRAADRKGLDHRETFRADLRLLDDAGDIIAEFEGMHFKRARVPAASAVPVRVRGMLHELAWREILLPLGGPTTPLRIEEQVTPFVAELANRNGLDRYARFLPELDAVAAAYIVAALRDLGFDFEIGRRFGAIALATELGVLDQHGRLFSRMLDVLTEERLLKRTGTDWVVASSPPSADLDRLCDDLLARHDDGAAELLLTRRCARDLAGVLRGTVDPLALLFPGGSLADAEKLYQESPPAKTYNSLIAKVVEFIAKAAPGDRPLRVLEIGAGTGSTTAYVLPALAARSLDYTFTDVSPLFLNRAREKFKDQPGVRYRLLDIGQAPDQQGFVDAGYDVILAANVLHATPDLDVTAAHVRRLLAPGGMLVLLEGTVPQRFGDLTVGLLDGWWAYSDTNRRQYALMPISGWLPLLREHGFVEPLAIPDGSPHPVLAQQAVFLAQAPVASASGRWLVVPDQAGFATELASVMAQAGEQADLLPVSSGQSLGQALREALAGPVPVRGVVHLAAIDLAIDNDLATRALMDGQERMVGGVLETVRTLAGHGGTTIPHLTFVTRGAQATRPAEAANPAQATLWGLSHVIAVEHPEVRCLRLDLDRATSPAGAAVALLAEVRSLRNEDQIALRGERRLGRRLIRHIPSDRATADVPTEIRPDVSYLVTGGLRGLGPRVAQWLVAQGARHLVLIGRTEPAPAARGWLDELRGRGVDVLTAAADVANEADVERVLGLIPGRLPPLAGVFHCAGALDDGVLTSQTWSRFATVMAAKVQGSWNLHRLARDLDFLVLFSSGASVAGSAGQANHAAANAFEDALAWYRQAEGRATVSINWGPWAEIGAAADRKLTQPGFLDSIAPADGLAALEYAMRRDPASGSFRSTQLAVLATDWAHLGRPGDTDSSPSPLFRELSAPAPTRVESSRAAAAVVEVSLRERLMDTAPNRRRTVLRDRIRQLTGLVLGLPRTDELDVDEPLRQLGLDSLMAVELRNRLGKAVGQALPATITFDHPSVAALTAYLAGTVFAAELAEEPVSPPVEIPLSNAIDEAASEGDLARELMNRLDKLGTRESL